MKAALKRGVETGVLVQVKASYKLSAKKAAPPKPKAVTAAKKATVVRKASTKKKVRWIVAF